MTLDELDTIVPDDNNTDAAAWHSWFSWYC